MTQHSGEGDASPRRLRAATTLPAADLRWLQRWCGATHYLAAAQIFLQDNVLLRRPLELDHAKPHPVGSWHASTLVNLLYAHVLRAARVHGRELLLFDASGQGAPGWLANAWLDGSCERLRPALSRDLAGMQRLCREFGSMGAAGLPGPHIPGVLSAAADDAQTLAHAVGAVLDQPGRIALALLGHGDQGLGADWVAWHAAQAPGARRSGAVVPVLCLQDPVAGAAAGLETLDDDALAQHFAGLGWRLEVVRAGPREAPHRELAAALDSALRDIRQIQRDDRDEGAQRSHGDEPDTAEPVRWPLIALRIPAPWNWPAQPGDVPAQPDALARLQAWLQELGPQLVFDAEGAPQADLLQGLPGLNLLPAQVAQRGTASGAGWLGETPLAAFEPGTAVPALPRLGDWLAQAQDAGWMGLDVSGVLGTATHGGGRLRRTSGAARAMAWMQTYVRSGAPAVLALGAGHAQQIGGMVDAHLNWLRASAEVAWQRRQPTLNLVVDTDWLRADADGLVQAGPGLLEHVLLRRHRHAHVYLAPDAACLLALGQRALQGADAVHLLLGSSEPLPVWLGPEQAQAHCAAAAGRWRWADVGDGADPDVVLACAGALSSREALAAVDLLRGHLPELDLRVVNVINPFGLLSPDEHPDGLDQEDFEAVFTARQPVLLVFDGYVQLLPALLQRRGALQRFECKGYRDEAGGTTVFERLVRNRMSRFQIAQRVLELVPGAPDGARALRMHCQHALTEQALCMSTQFEDSPQVRDWEWSGARADGAYPGRVG